MIIWKKKLSIISYHNRTKKENRKVKLSLSFLYNFNRFNIILNSVSAFYNHFFCNNKKCYQGLPIQKHWKQSMMKRILSCQEKTITKYVVKENTTPTTLRLKWFLFFIVWQTQPIKRMFIIKSFIFIYFVDFTKDLRQKDDTLLLT